MSRSLAIYERGGGLIRLLRAQPGIKSCILGGFSRWLVGETAERRVSQTKCVCCTRARGGRRYAGITNDCIRTQGRARTADESRT